MRIALYFATTFLLAGCASTEWEHLHITAANARERQFTIDDGKCTAEAHYRIKSSAADTYNQGQDISVNVYSEPGFARGFAAGQKAGAAIGQGIAIGILRRKLYRSCMTQRGWYKGDAPEVDESYRKREVLSPSNSMQDREPVVKVARAYSTKIMIFGGKQHDVYLGCLNCPGSASDSIFNASGKFGSCSTIYTDNLFCRSVYGEFGVKSLYKNQSACSSAASDPPVIVDEDGGYYGRFSLVETYGHKDSICKGRYGKFSSQDACKIVEWVCDQ